MIWATSSIAPISESKSNNKKKFFFLFFEVKMHKTQVIIQFVVCSNALAKGQWLNVQQPRQLMYDHEPQIPSNVLKIGFNFFFLFSKIK